MELIALGLFLKLEFLISTKNIYILMKIKACKLVLVTKVIQN